MMMKINKKQVAVYTVLMGLQGFGFVLAFTVFMLVTYDFVVPIIGDFIQWLMDLVVP